MTLGAGFIVCRWTIWRLGREAGATPAGAKQKPTTAATGAAAPPPQNPRRSHELTDYAHRQPCLMMRNHHQSTQSGCRRLFAAPRGRNFFGRQKRKNGQNSPSKDRKKYNNKGYPWEAILSEKTYGKPVFFQKKHGFFLKKPWIFLGKNLDFFQKKTGFFSTKNASKMKEKAIF